MKLNVVRHALTDANGKGIIIGQFDEPLSEKGRDDIAPLVKELHSYQFDAIYSSPLSRAIETAAPLADDHGLEIIVDSRIIEVNAGSFTMKPYDTTLEDFGVNSTELLNSYQYDLRPYGGESADDIEKRVRAFLVDLKTYTYSSVLIVTHGGIIRWFYYLLKKEKVGRFPNLSTHQFEI